MEWCLAPQDRLLVIIKAGSFKQMLKLNCSLTSCEGVTGSIVETPAAIVKIWQDRQLATKDQLVAYLPVLTTSASIAVMSMAYAALPCMSKTLSLPATLASLLSGCSQSVPQRASVHASAYVQCTERAALDLSCCIYI